MATVTLQNVKKSFGAHTVIHGIDLSIADGEFVTLVGPSGCGKSTLLRMIAGLEEISGGSVLVDGRVVNNVPAKRRDMAMVFQSYALYPHKTVFENMGFALRMQGMPGPEIEQKVRTAAETLGLSSLLGRYPRELSGGQRQRVAMGRAIVRAPKVFLFDEPLSNLDAKLRVQMRAEMKELHQRLKTTTIYVTHDQVEAMTLADRVVIMDAGRVAQVGTPLDVFDHPKSLFVAGFIGSPSMNLLNGRLDGDRFRSDLGLELDLPPEANRHVASGRAVYGIRPSDIVQDDGGRPATVVVLEPTGTETLMRIDMSGHWLSVVVPGRSELKAATKAGFRFDTSKAHLFAEA